MLTPRPRGCCVQPQGLDSQAGTADGSQSLDDSVRCTWSPLPAARLHQGSGKLRVLGFCGCELQECVEGLTSFTFDSLKRRSRGRASTAP